MPVDDITAPTLDAERTDLLAALATARSALTTTVRGLSDEQLGERPTASALCLGGLIKHVASIEEGWLRFVLDGPSALRYDLPDGVTGPTSRPAETAQHAGHADILRETLDGQRST